VIKRWPYRSKQFFSALLGRVNSEQQEEAKRVLGPRLYGIFAGMPRQYRQHALMVYSKVKEAGHGDRVLLQAALLHDSGKYDPVTGRYVTLGHRVAVVLLNVAAPGRKVLKRWAEPRRPDEMGVIYRYLVYPFYLSRCHAELGAALAAQRGASSRLVSLIREHQNYDSSDPALRALQAADESS
jgi:hypothetical protein